jgi:ribosomal protein L35
MRDELKALGLADEHVNAIMALHGKKMTEALNRATAAESESETAKLELKKYQKGGEHYIDAKEHERLKAFEKDTILKETNGKKTAALEKLYKGANASDSATKLLISNAKLDEIELDDKGELKGGEEMLKKAKADYSDLFTDNGNTGVPQNNKSMTNGGGTSNNKKQVVY